MWSCKTGAGDKTAVFRDLEIHDFWETAAAGGQMTEKCPNKWKRSTHRFKKLSKPQVDDTKRNTQIHYSQTTENQK